MTTVCERIRMFCLAVFVLLVTGCAADSTVPSPETGIPGIDKAFLGASTIRLPVPPAPEDRSYLGLHGPGVFSPSDIDADTLIIEVYSMYCPICQREAPRVNELYRLLESSAVSRRTRMIGIGAGNSAFEIGIFRDRYNTPFPLFADPDLGLVKHMGVRRTPTFIVLTRAADGTMVPVFSHVGPVGDPRAMLDEMLAGVDKLEGSSPD